MRTLWLYKVSCPETVRTVWEEEEEEEELEEEEACGRKERRKRRTGRQKGRKG